MLVKNVDVLALDDLQRDKGMNNVKLSHATGLDAATIVSVRNGNPCRALTLMRIARALGVPVEDLMKKEG